MSEITIRDVAREAGVSIKTVSRVLTGVGYASPPTRAKVKLAAQKLGYVPNRAASSLVTGRTQTIGIVVPDLSFAFYSEIVWSVEVAARTAGYATILVDTAAQSDQEIKALNYLREMRLDGIIVLSARMPENKLLVTLAQHRAVVSINRPVPPELGGNVYSNHAQGIAEATLHLIRSGRQVIAHMAGTQDTYAATERLRGFRQAMESAGRPVHPGLIVPHAVNIEGGNLSLPEILQSTGTGSSDWSEARNAFGRRGARDLLSLHPEVDGIVCFDDQFAYGALCACRELGRRVPDDVAIIGCNDSPLASQVTPALTTQRVPTFQMGAIATRMMIERIHGRTQQKDSVFQHELIVRASAPALP